jgi:ABC-type cobalamin/Fe3+-siderophores transport system ATPase subunit
MASRNSALWVEEVCFGYREQSILKNVALKVNDGEFLAIIGPNGCGKSTLLKVMAGLLPPATGKVYLGDRPIADFPPKKLARHLALLTQSGLVPDGMRVRDLVSMGRYAHESWFSRQTVKDRLSVEMAMQRMQVADLAEYPLEMLSGGQLQRVRMAMVLAQETGLLLLDEPTNHLDLCHQHALLSTARERAQEGCAVVAVLHDLTQASLYADRIAVMHQGVVVAEGTAQAVITADLIRHVYGISMRTVTVGSAILTVPEALFC